MTLSPPKPGIRGTQISVDNRFQWSCELRSQPNLSGVPLASSVISADLVELVEEAVMNSMLSGITPLDSTNLQASVIPSCKPGQEPLVDRIQVQLRDACGDGPITFEQSFTAGPWRRWSQQKLVELREEGSVAADQPIFQLLVALPSQGPPVLQPPPLIPPPVIDSTLEACGVRSLQDGDLTPDRPLLVNRRLVDESLQRCVEAGIVETGAAVAGQYVRLPEPLPGASTRIVTLLSALLFDPRHTGQTAEFHFSPAALVEAEQFCALRGLGESVITVFHTHGFGCGDCNQKAACALAEANPSLQDYRLLESLLPGKNTLMPIAGRKLGASGRAPVLQIHAWRGGEMRPIRWRTYED